MKTFVTTFAFSSFLAMSVSAGTSNLALRSSEQTTSTAISLEHSPTDLDDRQDNRELVTQEEIGKLLVISLAKNIPFVGGFLKETIDLLWDTSDYSAFWAAILEEVQDMIEREILISEIRNLEQDIQSLSNLMNEANDADWETDGSTKYSELLNAKNKAYEVYLDLRIATSSSESPGWDFTNGFYYDDFLMENMLTIEYAAIFAPMHLAILKDLCLYSVSYDDVSVSQAEGYCDDLDEYATKYQEYFEHMKNIFFIWRILQFEIINRGKTGGVATSCWGTWIVEDTMDEVPYVKHNKACYKDVCLSSYRSSGIDSCIDGKIEDYMEEVMADLASAFYEIVDPMLTIQDAAANRPEIITCSPVEIALWNSDISDWDCFERSPCLDDEVDGSCEDGDTCTENSDCQSDLCGDDNYCYTIEKSRRLEATPGYILDNAEWEEYKAICSDLEYTLSLAVDSHMQFLAEPIYHTGESNVEGKRCPSILFHRGSVDKEVRTILPSIGVLLRWECTSCRSSRRHMRESNYQQNMMLY